MNCELKNYKDVQKKSLVVTTQLLILVKIKITMNSKTLLSVNFDNNYIMDELSDVCKKT